MSTLTFSCETSLSYSTATAVDIQTYNTVYSIANGLGYGCQWDNAYYYYLANLKAYTQ